MACVYFVRHGESEWNVQDKICGSIDSPLTERGRAQALQTAQTLLQQGVKADVILYSPLSRAAETAKIIAGVLNIPAVEEPRLTEQNFGHWQGSSPRKNPAFLADKQNFVTGFGGGESMLRVGQRIYNLLDELKAQPDKTCILAAHNGIARFVRSYFTDMTNEEFAKYGIDNAAVLRLEF